LTPCNIPLPDLHNRHERGEKVDRASLSSKPDSLSGKFQSFEEDTDAC